MTYIDQYSWWGQKKRKYWNNGIVSDEDFTKEDLEYINSGYLTKKDIFYIDNFT